MIGAPEPPLYTPEWFAWRDELRAFRRAVKTPAPVTETVGTICPACREDVSLAAGDVWIHSDGEPLCPGPNREPWFAAIATSDDTVAVYLVRQDGTVDMFPGPSAGWDDLGSMRDGLAQVTEAFTIEGE